MLKKLYKLYTEHEPKTYIWVLVLILFAAIEHHTWIVPTHVYTHTDWVLTPNKALGELWNSYGTWINSFNFGAPNIQINFYGFYGLWSALYHLSIPYSVSVWLTFLVPIAILGVLSPFFLIKRINGDNATSFICALFYGTVIYFLARQTSQLAMVFIFGLSPLIILWLIKSLEFNKIHDWLIFILLMWVSSIYELRVTFILVLISTFYAIFFYPKKIFSTSFKYIVISLLLFIGMSMFWLLPTALGGLSSSVSAQADTGVFGASLFDLEHAFTISDSSWTGTAPNEQFVPQKVKIYLYVLPILAFLPLVLLKTYSYKERKKIIFFTALACIGIFLTKEDAEPLSKTYGLLYNHLPGFNLYREASKFYLITGIAYLFLINYFFVGINRTLSLHLKSKNIIRFTTSLAIFTIACINIVPFVKNDFSGMITPRHIPNVYQKFNNFINSQTTYSRVAWLPDSPRWATYSNEHPSLSLSGVMSAQWKSYVSENDEKYPTYDQALTFLEEPYANSLISEASIKYIVVPIRDAANDDDQFIGLGNDRSIYINELNEISWLKPIRGFRNLEVYENTNYKTYTQTSYNLLSLNNYTNFTNDFTYAKNNIKTSSNFTLSSNLNSSKIEDPFTNITRQNIENGSLNFKIRSGSNGIITINNRESQYAYNINNSILTLSRLKNPELVLNGNPISSPQTSEVATSLNLRQFVYLIKTDVGIHVLNKSIPYSYLGENLNAPEIYKALGANLISNGDFNKGLWQAKVDDCNNYNNKPDIYMSHASGESPGTNAVELSSFYHTACTHKSDIKVSSGQYALQFSYKVQHTDSIRYEIKFNNKNKTQIDKIIKVSDSNWHNLSQLINVPDGASSATLIVYGVPDPQLKSVSITDYANFDLQSLSNNLMSFSQSQPTPQYTGVMTLSSLNKLSVKSSDISSNNLISNPSLENGLWQKHVGDCNNYNNKPEIGMELNSTIHTQGKYSLELYAKSHIACTGPPSVNVVQNGTYLYSFDYKSSNASLAGYSLQFNDPDKTSEYYKLSINDDKWHTLNKLFTVPYGATKVSITLYSYSDYLQDEKNVNYYDNLYMAKIPSLINKYYTQSKHSDSDDKQISVSTFQSSPTKKIIFLKSVKASFYLTIAEAYDKGWALQVDDNKATRQLFYKSHYNDDSFRNGWYIDIQDLCLKQKYCGVNKNGTYNIELQAIYTPQRYFYIGAEISSISLFITLTSVYIYKSKIKSGSKK